MSFIQKINTSRQNYHNGSTRVGELDRIWYDAISNTLRISDGVTPGGKVVTSRLLVQSGVTGSIFTPNAATTDSLDITAVDQNFVIANAVGTPVNFQKLLIRIKDNGVARSISWGTDYVNGGVALPTVTVAGRGLTLGFIYNTANSLNQWQLVALTQEG